VFTTYEQKHGSNLIRSNSGFDLGRGVTPSSGTGMANRPVLMMVFILVSFPTLSDGMVGLLGISNASYLANKGVDHTKKS
jgi:hypothetical protein